MILINCSKFNTDRGIQIESLLSKYIKKNNGIDSVFCKIRVNLNDDRLGQGGNRVINTRSLMDVLALKFLLSEGK